VPRSQWRERVRIFLQPANPTVDTGVVQTTYAMVDSGDDDHAFWMSRGVPSGREATAALQRDQKADARWGCPDSVPNPSNGLLRHLRDGRLYVVTSVNQAPVAGQFAISSEYAEDGKYVTTGEP
jgi:hypothetical protein